MVEAESRKLAAIMFTDMVGYSALSQQNEVLALELLEEHRKLLRPIFPKHNGKEIKTIGDAFLVEFASAVEAARCAIEIQEMLHAHNSAIPAEKRLQIRIGLHVGDVVYREDDVFGDGVNIASRIEPLAPPEGICLSEDIARQIRNKIELPLLDLGRGELKNIEVPVGIYRIVMPWEKRRLHVSERWAFKLRQKRTRVVAAIAGGTLVFLLAAGVIYGPQIARKAKEVIVGEVVGLPTGPVEARRTIAVLGFKNLSGQPEVNWLSTALSEMLTTELAATRKLRTISGENVARMKIDLALADATSFAKDTLTQIQKILGADIVVLGSYLAQLGTVEKTIRFDLILQDTTLGETVGSVTTTGSETNILDMVSQMGSRLRETLGLGALSVAEEDNVRAAMPSDPVAARLYSEGLMKLRRFDALGARYLLEEAVEADPEYPLAHTALASAWAALGYDAKAVEEAKKAFELATNLSRENRLWVEGQYRETAHEWDKAIEIYLTLWNFFPDDLEYGLRLAAVQVRAGKGEKALRTVEALRNLPSPTSDDPRIDLAEASAAKELSDYLRQQAAAAEAAQKGETLGAWLLVAKARLVETGVYSHRGLLREAKTAGEEAQRLYTTAGDRKGLAQALNSTANVLKAQGDLVAAKKKYEQALPIFREIGNKRGVAAVLNNIAIVLARQGDAAAAQKRYEDALSVFRELDHKRGMSMTLGNLATVISDQGDLGGAIEIFEEALQIDREIGYRLGVAIKLGNIGNIRQKEGNLAAAKEKYEEALLVSREIGDKMGIYYVLKGLGKIHVAEADFARARNKLEEALEISNEVGDKHVAARIRLLLAGLLIEEGLPAKAEPLARQAGEYFHDQKVVPSEASAVEILARALLAQGKLPEAQEAIVRATELSGKTDRVLIRLSVSVTAARIQAATGRPTEAIEILEATLAEAGKAGLATLELDVRLALGEIEITSGNAGVGRARLAALEREATAKGFRLIAQKAAAATTIGE